MRCATPASLRARRLLHGLVAALPVVVVLATTAHAERSRLDDASALALSQDAIGREVADHGFINAHNRSVRLSDYRGKPLVVSLIYTSCSDICPVISETLSRAVRVGRDALGGESFHVVTVGFDARYDTPARMRAYARARGVDAKGWDFLSADGDTVDRLAADLGFVFLPGPQGFDHMAQTTVLDAEGRVYRQVYGDVFEAPALVEPLKQLVFGRRADAVSLEGIINKVRLICTIYDASSGRYRFDYSIFAMIAGGGLSLASIGFVTIRAWMRTRRLQPR